MKKIKTTIKIWWYKQTHFEFFSIKRLYFPVVIYSIYKAMEMRDFYWLKYVNPNIYLSGITEHSKELLLQFLPKEQSIKSFFIPKGTSDKDIERLYLESKISFPLVVKPDCGSRGLRIYKVHSLNELIDQHNNSANFLVQESVDLPLEFAVFYIRYPNKEFGKVTSLVQKEFMKFVGDGQSTLFDLIMNHNRAWLYIKRMKEVYSQEQLYSIVPNGSIVEASFVGSHSGGTIFYDKNNLITEKLSEKIDEITKHIPEFYYGRYDVKTNSFEEMEKGNFKILELNAAIGEPVHMYDPKTSVLRGYSILLSYWSVMTKIARINKKRKIIPVKKP